MVSSGSLSDSKSVSRIISISGSRIAHPVNWPFPRVKITISSPYFFSNAILPNCAKDALPLHLIGIGSWHPMANSSIQQYMMSFIFCFCIRWMRGQMQSHPNRFTGPVLLKGICFLVGGYKETFLPPPILPATAHFQRGNIAFG